MGFSSRKMFFYYEIVTPIFPSVFISFDIMYQPHYSYLQIKKEEKDTCDVEKISFLYIIFHLHTLKIS